MPRTESCRAPMFAALGGVLLAGCTLCPDPFDYSGPVPNGSAPQNDFRARSNGIVPIGLRPRPWPPIVKRTSPAAEVPAVAADPIGGSPTVVAEGPLDVAAAFQVPVADTDAEASVLEETTPEPLQAVPAPLAEEEPADKERPGAP